MSLLLYKKSKGIVDVLYGQNFKSKFKNFKSKFTIYVQGKVDYLCAKMPRYFIKGPAKLIGSFPSNQNTLYLLCLFYSDK